MILKLTKEKNKIMKNKHIAFFLLATFLSLPILTFAQPSGYLGKRLHLGIQANTSYSLNNPNNLELSGTRYFSYGHGIKYLFSFNLMKNISCEYVISKNTSLGVSYIHWKTKFYYSFNISNFNTPMFHTGDMTVKGPRFYIKQFFSPYAPIGNYLKMGFSLLKHNASVVIDEFQPPHYVWIGSPYEKTRFQFNLSLGKQSAILWDRFILDRSIDLNIGGEIISNKNRLYLPDAASHRADRGFLLNFALGLSFLP
jgi:hypothetical protein